MSEAKWWPVGVIPTEPGKYLSIRVCDHSVCAWSFPNDSKHEMLSFQPERRRFYGPIPEPPKEPPQLRRFTAKWQGEDVGGCAIENAYCDRRFQVYRNTKEGAYYHGCYFESDLTDIRWIDPVS